MKQVRISDGILMQEQEGDAFLLQTATGRYFGLNQTGVTIWRALERGVDPVEALGERWPDVPADVLRRDADALIDRLLNAGLVTDSAAH